MKFKSQASSSRAAAGAGFGAFGSTATTLSYLAEIPDLSSISDPNVVVCFKNLLKKDGTTKAKGLEDLRAYVQAHPYELDGGVEETILEAWVNLYPRLSIDNSRRVRELSHNLQFELLRSARKRMEKFIPKIVGSWLGGTYDRDRVVSRAAADGVASFLDNEKKVLVFWTRCQVQILDYALEAINETPQTLSDERTMTAEDLQAKYFRVVGSSISLVLNLLHKLGPSDIVKNQYKYEEFLSNNKSLWSLASCEDSFVRKTTFSLLVVCLEKQFDIIKADVQIISHAFIAEGLRSTQSSSALQLVACLTELTSQLPTVWTSSYKGKKPAVTRLRQFIERGSQGGPASYWSSLQGLLDTVPAEVLPSEVDASLELLNSFKAGLGRREESRTNTEQAWNSYFGTTTKLADNLSDRGMLPVLLQKALYPVFEQYLHPTAENSKWSLGNNTSTLAKTYETCTSSDTLQSSFVEEWTRLSDDFVQRLNMSLPEQSKDYHKSQSVVLAEGHRWFSLLQSIMQTKCSRAAKDLMIGPSIKILDTALEVSSKREGKPYSAAATVESALRLTPILLDISPSASKSLSQYMKHDLPNLISSPSSKYLVSLLFLFGSFPNQQQLFQQIWLSIIKDLATREGNYTSIIVSMVSNDCVADMAKSESSLQGYLANAMIAALNSLENSEQWELLDAAITFDSLSSDSEAQLVDQLISRLDTNEVDINGAFKALEIISKKNPSLLKDENKTYISLITKLLALSEIFDSTIPSQASRLRLAIEASGQSLDPEAKSPMLHVIRENLENATTQSLTVDTLLQQAVPLLKTAKRQSILFPDVSVWQRALTPHLSTTPNSSLAVMRPFAGALFLAQNTSGRASSEVSRDINGYSVPLRMAIYTARLLNLENSPVPDVEVLYLLSVTAQLVQDQFDLRQDNQLYLSLLDPDVASDIEDFLFVARKPLVKMTSSASGWINDSGVVMASGASYSSGVIRFLISKLIQDASTNTPIAFHAARILCSLLQQLINDHGWHSTQGETWLHGLDILKTSTKNILGAISVLLGLQDVLGTSKIVNTLCNRLISDISGASAQSEKTLGLLVLLNASLTVYDEDDLPVAQNRLIFSVKQILSWTDTVPSTYSAMAVASEACYALHRLLPAIKGVYGTYWESALSFCIAMWGSCDDGNLSEAKVPIIGMTLKLFTILRYLQDANDDLEDALNQLSQQISEGLVHILRLRRSKENVPILFIDDMLCREIRKLPLGHLLDDLEEFYPLVASDIRTVQSAAFDVLHRALPDAQQQISVEVLLENKDAQLPEELLSLLLDAPVFNNFSDEILMEFPTSIRGYLLSWLLVYDSYSNASFKVRNDYSEILKSENYIGPLLSFIFDVLGHSEGHPMNLANFEHSKIRVYDMWSAIDTEGNEKGMQWLLINIYYLCLKYTSSLAKNWWLDCKSKQTKLAVESWTERFFSPLVIEDTMNEVTAWAEAQETTEEEKELIIKSSKKSREVYAGYEVDDVMMQIVIKMPSNYPLQGVKVEGINRVAATERKWTGWLMNTQGAMTFDNGSITDGLTIFRKNVVGALKGKAECAICYSLISADKRMPDKACHTCKHLFHASCLFKWFASSNQSTCPLCRNPFNYGVDSRRQRAVA